MGVSTVCVTNARRGSALISSELWGGVVRKAGDGETWENWVVSEASSGLGRTDVSVHGSSRHPHRP